MTPIRLPRPGERGIQPSVPAEWWRDFFGPDYLLMYASDLTQERTARETECAMRALRLPRGARVLDLCCGFGRHLSSLRAMGVNVAGVERSGYQTRLALRLSQGETPLPIIRGDALMLPFGPVFDAVLSLYTSMGYFGEVADARQLREAARVLKPNGLLYIDNQNPEFILPRLGPEQRTTDPHTGIQILEEFEYDPFERRIYGRKTILAPNGRRVRCFALRAYTSTELADLLAQVGLRIEKAWGDFDHSPPGPDSPRIIFVARKAIPP